MLSALEYSCYLNVYIPNQFYTFLSYLGQDLRRPYQKRGCDAVCDPPEENPERPGNVSASEGWGFP